MLLHTENATHTLSDIQMNLHIFLSINLSHSEFGAFVWNTITIKFFVASMLVLVELCVYSKSTMEMNEKKSQTNKRPCAH